eukprot:SAG31_NODE_8496_length_1441_cov_1.161699_2_plen_176_part_01
MKINLQEALRTATLEFDGEAEACIACRWMNGYRIDKSHTLRAFMPWQQARLEQASKCPEWVSAIVTRSFAKHNIPHCRTDGSSVDDFQMTVALLEPDHGMGADGYASVLDHTLAQLEASTQVDQNDLKTRDARKLLNHCRDSKELQLDLASAENFLRLATLSTESLMLGTSNDGKL